MNAEREDPTKATERWPFDPMQPGDHEPAQLPRRHGDRLAEERRVEAEAAREAGRPAASGDLAGRQKSAAGFWA
jgi:hypothetical protein